MRESKLTKLGRLMGHYVDGEPMSDDFTRIFTDGKAWIDIPAPACPVEPEYEYEDKTRPWDYLDEHHRNMGLEGAHCRAMRTYEAQMEYYNSVIVTLQQ
ncbi:hypothetical protein AN911_00575 [Mycobacteroides immunogenum]|jgi:hypothetical protein|uniref:Uncharacterized protein n=1 Tax=Mycobacteroides immunogenum TaxID=83262 RepID=A0A7V8LRB8_9MYCO|nr:hypothetical protein AN909_05870 [Mycobacteroides immunogenum]KPG14239.1 hypothetical protein AN908_06525 [Mycobacteroides immunogenum]KPG14316.1 hypothetical protein AN908_07045 [Mycobacteroides immunogenum]KPG17482.1 hypothetical protein AN910_05095 [Mycobacteroides immunogenum]KPG23932.1 hypothetical protein AN911_00060 [Mycobacteroides immunogenum]